MTFRILALSVCTIVLVASGIVHGLQTNRWGLPDDVLDAADRLQNVPTSVGSWSSEEIPMRQRELELAEVVGHISRHYVNREDGSAVDVMILCGHFGPIAVHPPTVCFTGGGWGQLAPETKTTVAAGGLPEPAEFWQTDFRKHSDGVPVTIRTLWSWSVDGQWHASDNPRMQFAYSPHLYKMYVTRVLPGGLPSGSEEVDPSSEFLKVFLPQLARTVFADASPSAKTGSSN